MVEAKDENRKMQWRRSEVVSKETRGKTEGGIRAAAMDTVQQNKDEQAEVCFRPDSEIEVEVKAGVDVEVEIEEEGLPKAPNGMTERKREEGAVDVHGPRG